MKVKKTILLPLVAGCLAMFLGASVAHAGPKGECNRILAGQLGLINQLDGGVAEPTACVDLLFGLIEFVTNPNQCLELLLAGELFVKDNNLTATFCNVIGSEGVCAFPPGTVPPGVCPE